jgi:hypothetical protein
MPDPHPLANEPEGIVPSPLPRFKSGEVSAMMVLYEPTAYSSRTAVKSSPPLTRSPRNLSAHPRQGPEDDRNRSPRVRGGR